MWIFEHTQVEEELKALQEKLDNVHRLEMESLKHELEIQMNEKVSSIENKLHEKETGWNEGRYNRYIYI